MPTAQFLAVFNLWENKTRKLKTGEGAAEGRRFQLSGSLSRVNQGEAILSPFPKTT